MEPASDAELLLEAGLPLDAELLLEEERLVEEVAWFELDAFVDELVTGSVSEGCEGGPLGLAEPAGFPWDPAVAGPLGAGAVDVAGVEGPDFED